jgi:hypothetical protein
MEWKKLFINQVSSRPTPVKDHGHIPATTMMMHGTETCSDEPYTSKIA